MPILRLKNGLLSIANADFALSIRETFINIMPLYILNALLVLAISVLEHYNIQPLANHTSEISSYTSIILPHVIALTLGYNYSRHKKLDPLVGGILALTSYMLVTSFIRTQFTPLIQMGISSFYAILIPYTVVQLFRKKKYFSFDLIKSNSITPLLATNFNLIPTILVIILINCILFIWIASSISSYIHLTQAVTPSLPVFIQGLIHVVLVNLFWFFGIHGTQFYQMIFGTSDYSTIIHGGITFETLISGFVFIGGCGGTFSMIIAGLMIKKMDGVKKKTLTVSTPFQFFNINEIVTYGYAIILNRYFLVPFMLFPILSYTCTYTLIRLDILVVQNNTNWIHPVLFNAYQIGNGNVFTILYQISIIMFGAFLYLPFMKMDLRSHRSHQRKISFEKNTTDVYSGIISNSEIHNLKSKINLDTEQQKINNALKLLEEGELCLWYQPKIAVSSGQCVGFEALLRLKKNNGTIIAPYFLKCLEGAGFSNTIDLWVIQEANNDLSKWRDHDFYPNISINISDEFLASAENVSYILSTFNEYTNLIELEFLESSVSDNFEAIMRSVTLLQEHGVKIAIDDYGTGYANLSSVNKLNITTIKMDKTLLDNSDHHKGDLLYRHLCAMNKQLGYQIVAEGVETQQQVDYVTKAGVDLIQGWFYAKAMPPEEAMQYATQQMRQSDR